MGVGPGYFDRVVIVKKMVEDCVSQSIPYDERAQRRMGRYYVEKERKA